MKTKNKSDEIKFSINDYNIYYERYINDKSIILSNDNRVIESKSKTVNTYKFTLKRFIEYMIKHKIDITKIDEYDTTNIFKDFQHNKDKFGNIYANKTMKLLKVALTSFFEYLKAENIIDRKAINPFKKEIDHLKESENDTKNHIHKKVLTKEEIEKIISYIRTSSIKDKEKIYNAFLLMYCFGLRVDELSRIEKMDFTLIDNTIKLYVKPSKRLKQRFTYFVSDPQYKEDILKIIDKGEFNFKPSLIKAVFNRIKKVLQMENFSCHSLRHTFATNYMNLGGSIETLSKLLGHTNIRTTQIYADITSNRIESEVSNLLK